VKRDRAQASGGGSRQARPPLDRAVAEVARLSSSLLVVYSVAEAVRLSFGGSILSERGRTVAEVALLAFGGRPDVCPVRLSGLSGRRSEASH
jgi:hypothetical protein